MSLITISAIVKADASFAFPPYGLPTNKNISVQKTTTTGQYQITYDGVFASMPVVTVTQAWLGTLGSSGGSAYDNAVVNEITKFLDKAYTTMKVGGGDGHGQWRSFTVVLTGYQNVDKKEGEAGTGTLLNFYFNF
ncbi:uncharacterized protein LACBIDRAFT_331486 [Laccaria bicolor S238N-H82]|uniref:Predicted protein n=1 Tax=Laccaria bicolor (strain S238N-H82 / ATCC MYA-4686) TaxID=486041 RepID=B0DPM0_LACBS|nr:uncharacterized protein LACBIDRAFT_331486 [Laccaria bicolor S238N-H82]EDR03475.1 predicted protein [Laccaria bicolor S238N-H82]|eukprot:XP_001885931.1 predicted protein [Laccaria bicolor S238N-H82]